MHGVMEEHRVVLSYADLSVWCYACENYVHNEVSHNTVSPRWIGERYLQLYKGTVLNRYCIELIPYPVSHCKWLDKFLDSPWEAWDSGIDMYLLNLLFSQTLHLNIKYIPGTNI